jgi:FMN phosphatase YigB (HAD superfamily)
VTSDRASIGEISAEEHWAFVLQRLKRPVSELAAIRAEFFAGDIVDRTLVDTIRSLRGKYKTGLISNACDALIISAEVGVMKPEAKIYQLALEQLGVRPNEAVFVDDFEENIEGCEKVGIKGIHFKDPETALQQLRELL